MNDDDKTCADCIHWRLPVDGVGNCEELLEEKMDYESCDLWESWESLQWEEDE